MKLLTGKLTGSRLTSVINATDDKHLQELFCNLVYHALINDNANLERMGRLRTSQAPSKFKAALGKFMPIKWDKEAEKYTFDSVKADKLRCDLGISKSDYFEVVVQALPEIFKKEDEKKAAPVDTVEKVATNVANRLNKLKVENSDNIAQVMATLANNPSKLEEVMALLAL